MKIVSGMLKIIKRLIAIFVGFIAVTGIIYWFNLDMKLIKWLTPKMHDYYDGLERDRRL